MHSKFVNVNDYNCVSADEPHIDRYRRDHVDQSNYYSVTDELLQELLHTMHDVTYIPFESLHGVSKTVNYIYDQVVNILQTCADRLIPKRRANFFKFWWNQELNELKAKSVTTHRDWIAAGKPRSGVIINKQQTAKYAYKSRIDESKKREQISYLNDMNDALLSKQF